MSKLDRSVYDKKYTNTDKGKVTVSKRNQNYRMSEKGRAIYNFHTSMRRANILQATPIWANKEKIREFYLNCPKGYHVDHIVPLKGKDVSGLHVENNLQYLPALQNIKKGNRVS